MNVIDERFLTHRLRSTSIAGMVGGVLASVLWFYDQRTRSAATRR